MPVLGSVAVAAANHRPSSAKAAAGKGANKALEQKVEALTRAVRTIETRQVSHTPGGMSLRDKQHLTHTLHPGTVEQSDVLEVTLRSALPAHS